MKSKYMLILFIILVIMTVISLATAILVYNKHQEQAVPTMLPTPEFEEIIHDIQDCV